MMDENITRIQMYRSWNMALTPANYRPKDKSVDKHPVACRGKDGKFHWNINGTDKVWTDEELAEAKEKKRLAVYHNPEKYGAPGQRFFDAESDDKTHVVNKYLKCFPDTFTIGKPVNGTIIPTHKLYQCPKDVKPKQYGYDDPIEGKKVELLCSGVSVIDGLDRTILDSRKPVEADPMLITQHLQLATFFAELEKYWPADGKRNKAHLMLAGAFASQTNISLPLVKLYVKVFCQRKDDEEVDNRLSRYDYQYNAYKEDPTQRIYHIKSLADEIGGNFKSFDKLKRETENELAAEDETKFIDYPIVNFRTRILVKYPEVDYILNPFFTSRSTNQMSGESGAGKTYLLQAMLKAINSGHKFLDYLVEETRPTFHVEGELGGRAFLDRELVILNDYNEKDKNHRVEWDFSLTRDDLELAGLPYGFDPIAVSRMSIGDQMDYGRKGRRLVERSCDKIFEITGMKPFLVLDNITALADIDENRASDWTPLTQWTNGLKAKGIPNVFVHHSNKSTGTSSGSSAKERMLDTHLIVDGLDPDQRFEIPGTKSVQCRLKVGKARNFGGSGWDKTCLITMNDSGVWTKYPDLKQEDFKIISLYNSGIRTAKALADHEDILIAEKTIYKHLTRLRKLNVIDKKEEKKDAVNKQDTNGNAEEVF